MNQSLFKNLFRFFAVASFGWMVVFTYYTLVDYNELIKAYKAGNAEAELRHRINVAFEGTWALMSAMTMVYSIGKLRD